MRREAYLRAERAKGRSPRSAYITSGGGMCRGGSRAAQGRVTTRPYNNEATERWLEQSTASKRGGLAMRREASSTRGAGEG